MFGGGSRRATIIVRRILVGIGTLALLTALVALLPARTPRDQVSPEEYAVYDEVIRSMVLRPHADTAVVAQLTANSCPQELRDAYPGWIRASSLFRSVRAPALWRSLCEKATGNDVLLPRFKTKTLILTMDELSRIYTDNNSRHSFQRQYPPGALGLSRVIFDLSGTAALVYVEQHAGSFASHYVYLTKTSKGWRVSKTVLAFVQ